MRRLLLSIGVAAVALGGAPAAFAFTIEQTNNTNSDGSPRFVDPDEQIESRIGPQPGTAGITPTSPGGGLSLGVSPSYGSGPGTSGPFFAVPPFRSVRPQR